MLVNVRYIWGLNIMGTASSTPFVIISRLAASHFRSNCVMPAPLIPLIVTVIGGVK